MQGNTWKSFKDLIGGAWRAIEGVRVRFFAFVVIFILSYTLDLVKVVAIGYTLSIWVKDGFSPDAVNKALYWIGCYTALSIGQILLHHVGRYLQTTTAYCARMQALTTIFSAMITYPLRWHIQRHSGENLSKLHRSAGAIDSVVGTYVWQIIEGFVKIFFAGAAIFAMDFWLAAAVITTSLGIIGLMVLFNKHVIRWIRHNNVFANKISRICVDYLFNIVTVKTLGLEPAAKRYLSTQRPEGFRLQKKISKFMELKWAWTGVGNALVMSFFLLMYLNRHSGFKGPFDVGEVYVLMNYLERVFQAIGAFTGYYSGIIESATAYEDASEILVTPEANVDATRPVSLFDSSWQNLSIQNLNFSYVKDERIGLKDFGVTFKRGEKIALVGPSGGGKSTFLKILAGLLAPESYSISTDQQVTVNIEALSAACLLIPQEPEIFSETVLYNLTMGEEFETRELTFFVSLCKLDAVMAKLQQGWDTDLAEKGLNLSVGEKQRVALARGLLRGAKKSFILLDEPTSSLDPKTEKEIYHGVLYHFADRTVLSACHRLNLVPLFDRVIMVNQGGLLEMGSFPELIEKRGHFYRAWEDYQSREGKEQISGKEQEGEEADGNGKGTPANVA